MFKSVIQYYLLLQGHNNRCTQQIYKTSHLGGKVSLCLELLKEGRQEESGEEEDDRPE